MISSACVTGPREQQTTAFCVYTIELKIGRTWLRENSISRGPVDDIFVYEKFERQMYRSQGGIMLFSYIRRLVSFFGVQNFEFQYFWGFSKNEYFLGYEDFVDIFWGHYKIGLYLGVISMHFRVFF